MSVLFQIAGKLRQGVDQPLGVAFGPLRAAAAGQPGFRSAALLSNRTTRQFQLLLFWANFDDAMAFHRDHYPRASQVLSPLVESQGTVITSQPEIELVAANADPQVGTSVIIHMAGNSSPEAIAKLPAAVEAIRPLLEREPGYERAVLLVNHAEGKVQVMLQWRTFDEGVAFLKGAGTQVFLPFTGLMQDTYGPGFFFVEADAGG
jgi:heme-degrading monooxygenase HmoA